MKETSNLPEPGVSVMTHWSTAETAGADLTWGVGAVSKRLGVAASTLRTWERRYRIGPSHRTQGGHRRYTERDIDCVELVRRLVGRGVPAQDAARVARHLDHDALGAALSDEIQSHPLDIRTEDLVDAVLAAAVARDVDRLQQVFAGVVGRDRFVDGWRDVLSPALVRMACEASAGSLQVADERLATDLMVQEMRRLRTTSGERTQVVVASASEDTASLPLVALEAALGQASVTMRSLGPTADGREVAALTEKLRPDVVLLWDQPSEAVVPLRRHLERSAARTSLLQAGPAWPHEVGLRFGFEDPVVPTDVSGALSHVLDRVV